MSIEEKGGFLVGGWVGFMYVCMYDGSATWFAEGSVGSAEEDAELRYLLRR